MEENQRLVGEEDPYSYLKIVPNTDGSLTRLPIYPICQPNSSPSSPVLSKDVPLNPAHGTWLRIFRPAKTKNSTTTATATTLPIIIDYHGGGFILCSAATELFHKMCEKIALQIPAIIVTVDYRLAPEHRLPAAYDDAIDAIRWVRDKSTHDPWFDSADFTRCFLMGNSAGGNIVFHAAVRALHLQTPRFKIAGLILNEPFFGGAQRSDSELRNPKDVAIPLPVTDLFWELSLPAGADRDHEFCNPITAAGSHHAAIRQLPRCLITGHGQDPLQDRQKALVKLLEWRGVDVASVFDDDGYHGIEFYDPKKGQDLLVYIHNFVSQK